MVAMDTLSDILDAHLVTIGNSVLTPKLLVILIASVVALIVVTRRLERWGTARVLARKDAQPGAVKALFQILRYVALIVGLIAIVQSVGIDLSAFVVVVGTFGIGIGLALQPLLTNFIGGLVLLVEQPLKVDDRIEIGKLNGRVIHIGARATNIRTNDNIDVIVPNSELVSSQIVNWSHGDRNVRLELPVGISYGSDPVRCAALLKDIAAAHDGILPEPAPDVLLERFDDSAIVLVLRVWTAAFLDRPRLLRSDLNFRIFAALRSQGFVVPFPQREVHVHMVPPAAAGR